MVEKTEKEKSAESADKKEQKKKKPPELKKVPEEPQSQNFKGIVRLAGRDIRGHVPLNRALTYVRGIGHGLSSPIATVLGSELHISAEMKIGELSESQIEHIDKILMNLHDYPIPKCLFNRRVDMETGEDKHVIMNDLIFALKQDIERDKKAYTWRGYRHSYSQKVRGQRTRNTGRTGMAVGVLRKAILAAAAPQGKEGAAAAPAGAPAGAAKTAAAAAPAGGKSASTATAAKPAAKPAEKK